MKISICPIVKYSLAFVIVMTITAVTAGQSSVITEVVDEGSQPSMDVESDGTVHMVYLRVSDANEPVLVYARRDPDGAWHYRELGIAPYCRDYDIARDQEGNIHIGFSDNRYDYSPRSRLFHGILTNDGHWSRKIIAVSGAGIFNISLETDSHNELHLTCTEFDSPGRMMEMHTVSGQWSSPDFFGEWAYNCLDMTLDSEDSKHISYYSFLMGGLVYQLKPAAGNWSGAEKVEENWGGGQLEGLVTSIAADAYLNPHISYVGSADNDNRQHTKYAWKKDGAWHNSLVDRGQFQSAGNSLLVDNDGVAHLAYSYLHEGYYVRKDIRYASNITGTWVKTTLGEAVEAMDVDMGTDRNNNIFISYSGFTADYQPIIYLNKLTVSHFFNISPDTLDFRGVLPGEERTIALTMTNTFPDDITIDSIIANDSRISTDRNTFILAGNSVETLSVTLEQTAAYWNNAELKVWFGGFFTVIPLLVTNYQPELHVSEDPVEFGAVPLASTVTRTVRLSNNGIMDLAISAVTVLYEPFPGHVYPTDFSLVSHNCNVLHTGETCDVLVSFNPRKTGYQQSYLNITSNDPSSPVKRIQINGTTAHPRISVSAYDIDFGYCPAGSEVTKSLTIKNTGELNLLISGITVTGSDAPLFTQNHDCHELEPGDSCVTTITMSPLVTDDLEAVLAISSNAHGVPVLNISLHGTSLDKRLEITPASLDFGEVTLGSEAFRLLNFRNAGAGEIMITGIEITGDDQFEFSHDIGCRTIAAGSTCTDTVWYIPSYEGVKTASLFVSSNDVFHPVYEIPLTGGTGDALPLSVSIIAEPPSGVAPLSVTLNAEVSGGQGPYWYLWVIEETGRYTEQPGLTVQFPSPGIYSIVLHLTDITGICVADTVEVAVASDDVPVIMAKAEPVSGEIPLAVQFDMVCAGGDPPLTYLWEFRDGTASYMMNPVHTYTLAGTYHARVTVSDHDNDMARDSVTIRVKWNNSIAGQIWDDDGIFSVDNSVARLIPRTDILSVWSDVLEGSNSYLFDDRPAAEYTVRADPDTTCYPQYLPTYLGRKLTLNEATWVNVTGHINGQDIRLVRKPPGNNGSGTFFGSFGILSGPGRKTSAHKADENKGVYIYLYDSNTGAFKGYDITDEEGEFIFDNLGNGSYIIKVDYLGLPMNTSNPVLTITEDLSSVEIGITADADKITVKNLTTGMNDLPAISLHTYPVPATDWVKIFFPYEIFTGEDIIVRVIDMSGNVVITECLAGCCQGTEEIQVSGLAAGMYILEVTDNKITLRAKIIIMR